MRHVWLILPIWAICSTLPAAAARRWIIGKMDPNVPISEASIAQTGAILPPNGTYTLDLCRRSGNGSADSFSRKFATEEDHDIAEAAPELKQRDFRLLPAFMVFDSKHLLTIAALSQLGVVNFLGSYGIHQMAVHNVDLTPGTVEDALNVAWKQQIAEGQDALGSPELKIRISVIEFDRYRWFTPNGSSVILVTYTVGLMNVTEQSVSLPRELPRLATPTVEHIAEQLEQQNISVHSGYIFRGLWIKDPHNVTTAQKSITKYLLTSCRKMAANEPRDVQISFGRPWVTDSRIGSSPWMEVYTVTYLPFLMRLSGSVVPASALYNRFGERYERKIIHDDQLHLRPSPPETQFHFALETPVTFQDIEPISLAIGHELEVSLPRVTWLTALKEGNWSKAKEITFHLNHHPTHLLLSNGSRVGLQLRATSPITELAAVVELDASLPIYAPLCRLMQGRSITVANYSTPIRVLDACDDALADRTVTPEVGDRYQLNLTAVDPNCDPHSLNFEMLYAALGTVVGGFHVENKRSLDGNELTLKLTGYKGGMLDMRMNKVFSFNFSIEKTGNERSWNLWKFPSRSSLTEATERYGNWRLPLENERFLVDA